MTTEQHDGPVRDDSGSRSGDPYYGRMNDPTGSAHVMGACGDEMEFYLYIREGVIREARYYTEGCDDTRRFGKAAARAAEGKSLLDALAVSPRQLMDDDVHVTDENRHCAILSVITLYKAIADFLIQP